LNRRDAVHTKRPGQLATGVLLHHESSGPHTASATQKRIQELQWELYEHPPYSPDLVPSDFHLISPLKNLLCGKRFADEKVETEVRKWLRQRSKGFYAAGFDALVKRWDKCISVDGGYVEK
jgi:histone-lysine N-methyltransferase SETMAR